MMFERGILTPVLPEISAERLSDLKGLIAAERTAGIEPDPLRRLAALLPRDPAVAEAVAARLRLSNKARKRLSCAAGEDGCEPKASAYRIGIECAVDRLLIAAQAPEAAEIAAWHVPRLPITGGQLIKRGVPEGPLVAKTLRSIEDEWVAAGFPQGEVFERIVVAALDSAG